MKVRRRWVHVLIGIIVVPLALLVFVQLATAPFRVNSVDDVHETTVAVVFGAGVRPDGRPSSMLADRINAAVELYRAGRVHKLLMSGDNSTEYYDEVTAMQRYAITLGVPESDITRDYAGFSTYETCYRAKAIFGVERAVLVTQEYHLPRAVYTCRALGVDATGLGTADWGTYGERVMVPYTAREALATIKALIDVHLIHPLPTFLGPYEGIA